MEKMYSMLILAGGHSRRMGTDKAGLLLDGIPFWQVLVRKGKWAGIEEIYLSRGTEQTADLQEIHTVYDQYADRGPLAGMQAAFSKMETPYCLVVSVDVPQIPSEVFLHLLSVHQKRVEEGMTGGALLLQHEGRTEPLIGIYHTAHWKRMEEAIRDHGCSVFRVLEQIGYETDLQQVEEWRVRSLNTPKEYENILRLLQEEG